jgi:cob(I)alamin adenosyltransferase
VIKELNEESVELFKEKIKELHAARQIVKNIEREIEDLEEELEIKESDIKE